MAKTANEELRDLSVLYALYLQRYKTRLVHEVVSLLNDEVWPDLEHRIRLDLENLGSARFNRYLLAADTTAALISGFNEAEKLIESELKDLAGLSAKAEVKNILSVIPVKVDLQTPSPHLLEALVTDKPFEGSLLKEWAKSLEQSTLVAIERQITIGMTQGESVSEIVNRLTGTAKFRYTDGVFQTSRRNAEAIVRTAVAHTAHAARDLTIKGLGTVVKAVQWVSVLDTRTTPICRKLDGDTFPIDSGPRPPIHFGCRSTIIAVLKSWKELGLPFSEASESTRASLTGQIPGRITYKEWLSSQSNAVQNEALGPTRAKLFRAGKVQIEQFVDSKGKTLTLDQLRKQLDLN